MHKTEDHHHTPEQVRKYVEQAKAICDDVPLLEDERVALLPTLVTILSSKQVFYMEAAPLPNLAIPRGNH